MDAKLLSEALFLVNQVEPPAARCSARSRWGEPTTGCPSPPLHPPAPWHIFSTLQLVGRSSYLIFWQVVSRPRCTWKGKASPQHLCNPKSESKSNEGWTETM